MTTVQEALLTLGDGSARQLANATKTTAKMTAITPRWLVHLLPWEPVEAGIYRRPSCGNLWGPAGEIPAGYPARLRREEA